MKPCRAVNGRSAKQAASSVLSSVKDPQAAYEGYMNPEPGFQSGPAGDPPVDAGYQMAPYLSVTKISSPLGGSEYDQGKPARTGRKRILPQACQRSAEVMAKYEILGHKIDRRAAAASAAAAVAVAASEDKDKPDSDGDYL